MLRDQFLETDSAVHAGAILAEQDLFAFGGFGQEQSTTRAQGDLDRVDEPRARGLAHHHAVHQRLDVVAHRLAQAQVGLLVELEQRSVHTDAVEAVDAQLLEQVAIFPLAGTHHGREQQHVRTGG